MRTTWSRLGWEHINTWKHPQTTSSCCRRKLPYFCGHVPQESGTRAGGSLSENWPKRPRHANKTSHGRKLRMLNLDLWKFWVNLAHKKIRWRGLAKVLFEWKVLKFWTSAAIFKLSSYWCKQNRFTTEHSIELQRIIKLDLSPSTSTRWTTRQARGSWYLQFSYL